jgi:hypothetical protein
MSEEPITPQAEGTAQTDDAETIDNSVDPAVAAMAEKTIVPPIVKPRKHHPVIWTLVALIIIAFGVWGGWMMFFRHV